MYMNDKWYMETTIIIIFTYFAYDLFLLNRFSSYIYLLCADSTSKMYSGKG
jgi:hypothetical protein